MVMRIKRYEGEEKDLPRIIRQIKRDLGENAVVKTRRYKKGGLLGMGGKGMVEVYAGIERDLNADARDLAENPPIRNRELLERIISNAANGIANGNNIYGQPQQALQSPVIYNPPGGSPVISPSPTATQVGSSTRLESDISRLAQEIADIKRSIQENVGTKQDVLQDAKIAQFPRWLQHVKEKLVANEVNESSADRMLEETLNAADPQTLQDFEASLTAFQRTITSTIEARGSLKGSQNPKILALAGPTGVGKTTTLAKLAATANLLDKQNVGLISADTYRIAAIDQLKTFAGILDIPIKVVFSPAELREALNDFSDMDRVFIDTAGRSPNSDERIDELRELVAAHDEVNCHLVVSATTRPKDMQMVCERFRPSKYSRFIFTKIDETCALGPVLSLMYDEGLPASYLTNGQSVPDDIVLAEESDIINLVIRRSME
jgi:flagellar biosynthesis protein FlhF